jgi:hypothetical protein
MTDLLFALDDVARLLDHATNADSHRLSFEEVADWAEANGRDPFGLTDVDRAAVPAAPALIWVKDQGSYLMSSGQPHDTNPGPVYARLDDGTVLGPADGNPASPLPEGIWDLTRDICGGDDFSEKIGVDFFADHVAKAQAAGAHWFAITPDGDAYTISFI